MTVDLARVESSRAIAVLREQIAPDATDDELAYFAQVCRRLDLSPFADQVVLIGRWDSRVGRKVHRHQITVAGRRTLAARTGELVRIDGPVWCGPRSSTGELVWREVWDDDNDPPYCAWVLVVTRASRPDAAANGTAKWSEFVQTNRDGTVTPMWARMPSHMLGKCAESLALRRAFPDVIDAETIGGFRPAPADEYDDDRLTLDEASAVNAIDQGDDDPLEVDGSGAPVPARGPVPASRSGSGQADAHRTVGLLNDDDRAAFLTRWGIDDFGDVWPAEAVAAVLEGDGDAG